MRRILLLLACGLLLSGPAAAADPVVELVVNGQSLQGRSVAHGAQWCWLASPAGSYQLVDLAEVSSFRRVSDSFRPSTVAQVAHELKQGLGRTLEVQTRGQYVVCAPKGRAEVYAELLHEVSGRFTGYFSRKGWRLPAGDYPLLMFVVSERADFEQRCQVDGLTPSDDLRGYYHPLSNRIWIHDGGAEESGGRGGAAPQISEVARNTAVHEGIHQLAFNQGLHSRIAANPRWVVEGLATMLEAGALEVKSGSETSARINESRLARFREYSVRRRDYTIADFLVTDELQYRRAPLDFYSEAWALTFYLAETRRSDYVKYLQALSARDPGEQEYSGQDRIEDFQKAFGKDLRRLETQFVRFIGDLETSP